MKYFNPMILGSVGLIVVSLILATFGIYARYSPYYFLVLGIFTTLHFIEELLTQFWVAPADAVMPLLHDVSRTKRIIDQPIFIQFTIAFNIIMWICIVLVFLEVKFFYNMGEGLAMYGVLSMIAHGIPAIKRRGYYSGVITSILCGIVGLALILATFV